MHGFFVFRLHFPLLHAFLLLIFDSIVCTNGASCRSSIAPRAPPAHIHFATLASTFFVLLSIMSLLVGVKCAFKFHEFGIPFLETLIIDIYVITIAITNMQFSELVSCFESGRSIRYFVALLDSDTYQNSVRSVRKYHRNEPRMGSSEASIYHLYCAAVGLVERVSRMTL